MKDRDTLRREADELAMVYLENGDDPSRLQARLRDPNLLPTVYDSSMVSAAIVQALNSEYIMAWIGDGVSIVEQIVRAQAVRAEKAEKELKMLRFDKDYKSYDTV